MKSSTERAAQPKRPARRSENQRSTRTTRAKRYNKQTARIEARRDGKPLIFGWGKHLSHNEKVRIQRRATWIATALIGLILVGTIVAFWININIVVPGLPITSVNGHQIPQSEYREMLALKTQLEVNKLYGPHGLVQQGKDLATQDAAQLKIISDTTTQINTLNTQIKALPAGPSAQRTSLNSQLAAAKTTLKNAQDKHQSLTNQINNINQNLIPIERQGFTESSVGTDSVNWLQDDELIREWLVNQNSALQARINPSSGAIDSALKDLKANMSTSGTYNFLGQMGIGDDQLRSMLTIELRRNNMQTYLASLVVSPAYQVLARTMTIQTLPLANQVLKDLKSGQDFGKLAKKYSQDPNTNNQGGYIGWLVRGQYANQEDNGVVENWIFDPARTLNQISPVLTENGSYHILQILGFDPSRAIDSSVLQTLKTNALQDWLLSQQALPGTKITPIDQNKLIDPMNLPPVSVLPSAAPATAVPGAGAGAPSP